jgi:hypothetical protein
MARPIRARSELVRSPYHLGNLLRRCPAARHGRHRHLAGIIQDCHCQPVQAPSAGGPTRTIDSPGHGTCGFSRVPLPGTAESAPHDGAQLAASPSSRSRSRTSHPHRPTAPRHRPTAPPHRPTASPTGPTSAHTRHKAPGADIPPDPTHLRWIAGGRRAGRPGPGHATLSVADRRSAITSPSRNPADCGDVTAVIDFGGRAPDPGTRRWAGS